MTGSKMPACQCFTRGRHVAPRIYFATYLQVGRRAEGRAGNAGRETCIYEIYLIQSMPFRFWRQLRLSYGPDWSSRRVA